MEAGDDCYEDQLAVASCIVNRVKSKKWGKTISDVIYADGQFYLKADDGNRDDFARLGLTPLTFQAPSGRIQVLPYYPLPDEAADDEGFDDIEDEPDTDDREED